MRKMNYLKNKHQLLHKFKYKILSNIYNLQILFNNNLMKKTIKKRILNKINRKIQINHHRFNLKILNRKL